jgi:hypothetical protein
MKITKRNFVDIAGGRSSKPILERPHGNIERGKWIEYIENHKDIFMWYEDTPDGKEKKKNFDQIPDWAKESAFTSLDKLSAYTVNKKLSKKPYYLIFNYIPDNKAISVHREITITIPVAELLLDMAKFLDSKVIVNGSKIFESIDQLE